MNPKVSVIVPIYKAEQYLERCIRSLMEQTLVEMEYIFINDCTPDNSMEVFNTVIACYPRRQNSVRIIENPHNMGTAYVRTQGLKIAMGDYIGWCDADDWCERDMFEKMWNAADQNDCDIVTCNYSVEDDCSFKEVRRKKIIDPHKYIYNLYKEPYCLSEALWDKIVRRELIEKHHIYPFERIDRGEDFNMFVRTFYFARKCKVLDDCLYHYWQNPTSMTYGQMANWEQQKKNFDMVVDFLMHQDEYGLKKTCDFIKFNVKMQFKNLFPSKKEWFNIYKECHSSIIHFESIPLFHRIPLYIVYSSYFFFSVYRKTNG